MVVGTAIDLLGTAADFIINYQSVDLSKFNQTIDAIKKVESKGDGTHTLYGGICSSQAKKTKYGKQLLEEEELRKAIASKWTGLMGGDYTMKDIVENYFNNHYFGLIDKLV